MVAIHSPPPSSDWLLGSARAGARSRAPPARPAPSRSSAAHRLPDRATRVRRRRLACSWWPIVASCGSAVLGVQAVGWLARAGRRRPRAGGRRRPTEPVAGQRYVVQPGDTLWSIATEIAPDADPRAVVDALRDANGGPELEVGERTDARLDSSSRGGAPAGLTRARARGRATACGRTRR